MYRETSCWNRTAFVRPTLEIARALLGAVIVRELPQGQVAGRIVETEAYLQDDPACHAVRTLPGGGTIQRQTPRNAAMFGPPGHAYVYFTYGNHYLLNVVTQVEGVPEAVLIRALEPLEGLEIMAHLRGATDPRAFTSGPGKLCKALGIDRALDGHDLSLPPLRLLPGDPVPDDRVITTPRIGITRGVEMPWRFVEREKGEG
jgi:DNA-3-methyladenine glycosylase